MRISPVSSFTRRLHGASSLLKLRGLETADLTEAAGRGLARVAKKIYR